MEKTFGTLVRHLRLQRGDSLRGFAREVVLSANFVSNMERGKTPPPGEDTIVRMAAYLGQNHDEMLALAGKVRERLRAYFDSVPYPCLVDVKGRFFPAEIPDLSGFTEVEDGTPHGEYSVPNQRFVQ